MGYYYLFLMVLCLHINDEDFYYLSQIDLYSYTIIICTVLNLIKG